ncbi:MAG: LLM class F420-dependent oxidoreductase, partial [Betaproteobacteria bacterium]|nr:LLM class F420-dependent oxidoreductase [Betaproteobacteria bacterium]
MSKLRLGLALGYASGPQLLNRDIVLEAERLGFDSVWTAEA